MNKQKRLSKKREKQAVDQLRIVTRRLGDMHDLCMFQTQVIENSSHSYEPMSTGNCM